MVVFISEAKVLELLDWPSTFEAVQAALKSVSQKQVDQTARTFTKFMDSANSLLLTMPGCLNHPKFGGVACKLVTMNPNNAKLDQALPTINANIALFDTQTGVLKAIIGATEITKWRTAAASAVATKVLTNGENRRILAVLGAGTQGRIHAEAFHHFFNFSEIRIWNHNPQKAKDLVSDLKRENKNDEDTFKYFESNEECVRGADVIITATFATTPIVEFDWLKGNVHINAVGAGITHHSELSPAIYQACEIYVDHLVGAKVELAGLVTDLGVQFKGEIGDERLVRGRNERLTVFQSLGMAVEDCAMARLVYDRFLQRETGINANTL